MRAFGALIGCAYFLLWVLLLPLRLLAKGFYEELLERFTPAGQQEKRERLASLQRQDRMERWVTDTYPSFSFNYCPADPDDENFETLNEDWIWELQSICSEFDEWEEQNGPYKKAEESGDEKTDLIDWVGSLLAILPLAAYLVLLFGLLKLAWRGLEVVTGLTF